MAKAKKQQEEIVEPEIKEVQEEGAHKKANPSYTVRLEFRDKNDFSKLYKRGEDVSHFEQSRLDNLVKRGLVNSSLND